MPYKRYNRPYRYKKRYNRRKPSTSNKVIKYVGYAGKVANTASKALAVAYGIKKLLNVEYKFHDVQVTTATNITTTPTITQLSNIPIGDTANSRDGNQVKATQLDLYFQLLFNNNETGNGHTVRLMVVHDRQTNGAIYSASDVLVDASAINNVIAPLNIDNKYRFGILYNKTHTLESLGSGINRRILKIHIPLEQRIRFDGSAGDITDLTSSSYSFMIMGDEGVTTPTYICYSRLRYIDN